MNSALYTGQLRHRRTSPRRHRLAYPVFMLYADLDEIDRIFDGSLLWSARRPAPAWLRRADYTVGAGGPPDLSWAEAVRREASERLGRRIGGPVRLLTNPRTLGFRMNPVSFYYCFEEPRGAEPARLGAVLAEVTNTPWGESHVYAVDLGRCEPRGAGWEARLSKDFHVSPFLPMEMEYAWRFAPPGRRLVFHMENHRDGGKVFDATLSLRRRRLDRSNLRRVLFSYPALTLRTFLWIYLNAALLKLRGIRFHPRPRPTPRPEAESDPAV
jgi:uncharacterized protein